MERTGVAARIGAAPLEHPRRHGRQRVVDFGQDAGARLEQSKTHLVTMEARVEAQHVIGKRGELAEQLDANQAAADHDHHEAGSPPGRVGFRVGAFGQCTLRTTAA